MLHSRIVVRVRERLNVYSVVYTMEALEEEGVVYCKVAVTGGEYKKMQNCQSQRIVKKRTRKKLKNV